MAKRIFFQTRLYDYTSLIEAHDHIEQMEKKGWKAKNQSNRIGVQDYIFTNGQDEYKFSVEYYKER